MGSCLGRRTKAEGVVVPGEHDEQSIPSSEKTSLLSPTPRSAAGYSVRREGVASNLESSASAPPRSPHPAPTALGSVSHSYQPSNHVQPSRSEAATKFQFLDRNYSLETPSCLLPQVNELFKSICERYDIAVTNREKVDEALQLFKKVLQVDPTLPIVDCFTTWKSQLTSPRFNVTWGESSLSRGEPSSSQGKLSSSRGESLSQDVKKITVRAEEVPRLKRKAQKHIRDLLDACHLFLQQRDFLQREIANDLEKLELISRDIPSLCKGANLSSSERKQMPQVVKRARDQFAQFPTTIDWFWNQVFALLSEINTAVHVLQDSSE